MMRSPSIMRTRSSGAIDDASLSKNLHNAVRFAAVAHHPDELSIQLHGKWLNRRVKLPICLRFAFVNQIAVEDKGIRA